MRKFLIVGLLSVVACGKWAREPNFGSLKRDERPFDFRHNIELFEVSNGMRVALIPDDRTNVATVDLRYAVGAAEDPVGRVGLAHLAEHLLFELRAEAGGPTLGEELGELALHNNAFTSWDSTHYTATLPVEHLEQVLKLEARRMRAPCDQLDEPTFRREVDVVKAEERLSYTPISAAYYKVMAAVYGDGHPYARPLGSDEIATATRDEVCAFITANYAPDRAYLVITGPFDPKAIQAFVGRTFGPIVRKAGPRKRLADPNLDGSISRHPAPIERPMAMVFLPHADWGDDGAVSWDVVRAALAGQMAEADDENGWITNTAVEVAGGERSRVLVVGVEVSAAGQLEQAAQEVFARAAALDTKYRPRAFRPLIATMALRYMRDWDDLAGRGAWIADFMQFTDHNWFMLKEMKSLAETQWHEELPAIAHTLIKARSHIAFLTPSGAAATKMSAALPSASHQLTPWRPPVEPADADKPVEITAATGRRGVESYQLDNGLQVVLAPDRDSPIFDARLVFPVGRAHEPADRPYLATAAAGMLELDEDAYLNRDVYDKLVWALQRGTATDWNVDSTATIFSASGSAIWSDWHLWVLSWWMDQGTFNRSTLRMIQRHGHTLSQTETSELDEVSRAVLSRLYGEGHAYANPPPPVGASFLRIEAADLHRWKADHFRARGATLVVSGSFEVDAMKREIGELFGPWDARPAAALPTITPIQPATGPSWFAVDEPGALQTQVYVAFAAGSDAAADEPSRQVLVEMVREELRVLREGMGATYNVSVAYDTNPAGSALEIQTRVDEARTPEAVELIVSTLERLRDDAAGQRESFVRARKKVLAHNIAQSGGATAVADELQRAAVHGHGATHAQVIATRLSGLTPIELGTVATADLDPARRVVLVRGKPAAVAATYSRLAVTPEKLKGSREVAAEKRAKEAKEPKKPTATTARETHTRGEAKLYVGSRHAIEGPTEPGLYLGDRKLTLDEYLGIGDADDIKRRMSQRRWIKRGLLASGLLALGIGITYAVTAETCDGPFTRPGQQQECDEQRSGDKDSAAVFSGLGIALALSQTAIGKGKPNDQELADIAARYNSRRVETARVTPVAMPGGGGLVLSGSF